ncbi:Endonuclease III [Candidatus Hydrogenisulfobacillus filiaventi]|uniref:Endonuclease III n=1 Tax=Candidatus Hydrogenisulfobacillus filiaventi TaxID=2707344 RepID=A0A6F8ZFS0_9FIRM|nr:endonuclease [Bacillota bacterium]CAB1128510.1 Endonuclease III [Candidatus Hydrogenisulfobacillus filiaventi]
MTEQVDRERLWALYRRLWVAFGPQGWWPAESPFEVAVGAILTQAVSWRNVSAALDRIKAAGALSVEALLAAPPGRLEEWLRPTLYFRAKAAKLRTFLEAVRAAGGLEALWAGPPAEARARLLAIPGIGPETADDMMLYGAGQPVLVVDAYTHRILVRAGVVPAGRFRYEPLRRGLEAAFAPPDVPRFKEFHALVVRLGKDYCRPQPRCGPCPARAVCATGRAQPGEEEQGALGDVEPGRLP